MTAEGCEAFALSAAKRSCGGALFCSSCAYGRPLTAGTRTLAQQTVSTPLSGSAKGSGRRRTTSKQRWNCTNSSAVKLLRQSVLADDVETAADAWRICIRLSSPYGDGVVALSDDRIAIFSDHAQVTLVELEMYFLLYLRLQVNALKSAKKPTVEIPLYGWEFQI